MESVRKLSKNMNMSVINDQLNVLISYALAVNHCSLLKSKLISWEKGAFLVYCASVCACSKLQTTKLPNYTLMNFALNSDH